MLKPFKVKAIFFDLDGTLLDTSKDLGGALNRTLEEAGKAPLSDEVMRPQVSNGANGLLKLGFGIDKSHAAHSHLRERLLHHYTQNIAEHTKPFSGIEKLIKQCVDHDIHWGIVTNKPWAYTEPLMQYFRFASEPCATVCPDHVSQSKPAAEPLYLACEYAGCSADEAIYVGDHIRDIECGINAGSKTIAVGYGFTQTETDHLTWGADYTVSRAEQIWPIVAEHV